MKSALEALAGRGALAPAPRVWCPTCWHHHLPQDPWALLPDLSPQREETVF